MKIDKDLEKSIIELIKGFKLLNLENKRKTLTLMRLQIANLKLCLKTQELTQPERTRVKAYLQIVSNEIGVVKKSWVFL